MPLSQMSLNDFSLELASSSPAPGGGSASAVAGALAASLSSMVANLTIGKKGYEDYQDEMKALLIQAEDLRNELMLLIDQDSESFHQLLKAMKLPKNTDEEKIARTEAIQASLKKSSEIPMQIAQKSFCVFALSRCVLLHGNKNAVTDALVSAMFARTAVLGALLNVRINLLSIKDEFYVSEMRAKVDTLRAKTLIEESNLLEMSSF